MSEENRGFTVRVPIEIYFELSRRAAADNVNLNTKVNQILLYGLDRCISLDEALRKLIQKTMLEEEK